MKNFWCPPCIVISSSRHWRSTVVPSGSWIVSADAKFLYQCDKYRQPLIVVCTVCYSINYFFRNFLQKDEWLCPSISYIFTRGQRESTLHSTAEILNIATFLLGQYSYIFSIHWNTNVNKCLVKYLNVSLYIIINNVRIEEITRSLWSKLPFLQLTACFVFQLWTKTYFKGKQRIFPEIINHNLDWEHNI
jgi:hypothetical protein